MGNKVITGLCMRDEGLDFEDIADADFDFISVAVRDKSCATPSSRAYVPANKMVAVVPVDLSSDSASVKMPMSSSPSSSPTPVSDDQSELSFNDRLNMLTWDPEDIVVPSYAKRQDICLAEEPKTCSKPVLDTSRPNASSDKVQLKRKKPFGWFSRAVDHYRSSAATKKQEEGDKTRFIAAQPVKQIHEDAECEDPISDTESESYDSASGSELSFCDNEEESCSTSAFAMAYSFLRKESSSDSIGSCDSFEDEEDDEISMAYFSSANATCMKMSDYLCRCGSCPVYSEIEKEVTSSNCWMNEHERRSICRILQAYSTYNEAVGFRKHMVSSAEECLLVFHGDENAAFNAFVLLGQEKWE